MGSFSIWHWIIVLIVILVLFGSNKLRNLGNDLGTSLKGFKDAMKEDKEEKENKKDQNSTLNVEQKPSSVEEKNTKKNDETH